MNGRRALGLAVGALALAALLPVAAGAATTHVVVIENMQFTPATLTVHRGDRVVWKNQDLVPHTATAEGRFDSGDIPAGKSRSWVARSAGRHAYVCRYHPGMQAVLEVR